ncbi:ATP-binding protein [Halorussus marinus]|uniref:ATP-binding protein n=1 Tax=Halorussus marinus TaxID=2505976 RepID=UPI00106E5FC1|nr:DUF87 domain-containing protein [Halorussus marinus]
MSRILGRRESESDPERPAGHLGSYRARDGSPGARVRLDFESSHAGVVVGKRGYGKSYTLGVLAEELADSMGVAPIVADPMGIFDSLGTLGAEVVAEPRVAADALGPRTWCDLLGLAPDSAVGALVWRAAAARATLEGMQSFVAGADTEADRSTRRAAENHLALADSWDAFAPDGLTAADLLGDPPEAASETRSGVVVDLSGLDAEAANAVVRGIARDLYDHCVRERPARLPWLLVDEAHAFFDGVAGPALRTVLTRGRQPGVSLVAATQRPAALPAVAVSQADLLFAHRLTSRADIDALGDARPTYVASALGERLPENPGEALVVDDATESVHAVRIRERETAHGGGGSRASDRA